jgi:hypothetical protein
MALSRSTKVPAEGRYPTNTWLELLVKKRCRVRSIGLYLKPDLFQSPSGTP